MLTANQIAFTIGFFALGSVWFVYDAVVHWPRKPRRHLEKLTGIPPYHVGGRRWPYVTDITIWR